MKYMYTRKSVIECETEKESNKQLIREKNERSNWKKDQKKVNRESGTTNESEIYINRVENRKGNQRKTLTDRDKTKHETNLLVKW